MELYELQYGIGEVVRGIRAFEQIEETRELTASEKVEKELLVDNLKTRTKRMAAFYKSPEYESQQLIEELAQLKRTNLANEKRIQVIEERISEIKNSEPLPQL